MSTSQEKSHKFRFVLLIIIALLVVMTVTCPKKADHITAVSDTLTGAIHDTGSDEDEDWRVIGSMLGNKVAGAVLESTMEVNNCIIFSIGKLKLDGNDKVVSVGLLNHVFTAPKEKLRLQATDDESLDDFLNGLF